jgi:hypothetical protein
MARVIERAKTLGNSYCYFSKWKNNKEINIWQEDEGMLNVPQYSDFCSTFENLNM